MNAVLSAISLRDLTLSYGDRKVIEGLTLEVGKGDVYGLIGLNGVGKTTLIKAMTGLRAPDRGSVTINGADVSLAGTRSFFAFLPERFDPPSFLSGLEFLRFSSGLYGKVLDDEKALVMADDLGLERAALNRRIKTYSKGMRQKLGLMATFLTPAPLLILDEPMSGLDPQARAQVKNLLNHAVETGHTIFLSSHILADMNEICSHVGVLSGGRLIFEGTPAALAIAGGSDNLERAFLSLLNDRKAA